MLSYVFLSWGVAEIAIQQESDTDSVDEVLLTLKICSGDAYFNPFPVLSNKVLHVTTTIHVYYPKWNSHALQFLSPVWLKI